MVLRQPAAATADTVPRGLGVEPPPPMSSGFPPPPVAPLSDGKELRDGPFWAAVARYRRVSDALEDRWQARVHVPRPLRQAIAWFVTFQLVCLGWVFFRATSFGNATEVLSRLFASGTTALDPVVVLVVVAALATQFIPRRWTDAAMANFSRWSILAQAFALGGVLIVIDVWGPVGVAPFIYFRF
jgi:hypothetical protein